MAGSGLRVCAFGSQAARKGSWMERGGYPSIGHFRTEFLEDQSGCSAT